MTGGTGADVLIEERPDLVVEYLPPHLEMTVAVSLTVSYHSTAGLIKAD